MSKPRLPSGREGYAVWKERSIKDVHVRDYAYTFKGIESEDICDQDSEADKAREVQKFAYDRISKELKATFSGTMQSSVVDVFIKMIQEPINHVVAVDDEEGPCYHTKTESRLFEDNSDEGERYRIVGDLLITTASVPRLAVETAVRETASAIKAKVNKWFLLPSMVGVVLVQLQERTAYRKPTTRRQEDDVFLSSSWAWLNCIEDDNEGVDLFDCSKPVVYGGHEWFGPLTCVIELYEPDLASKTYRCKKTAHYEFTVPGEDVDLEVTEDLKAFEERFSHIWSEAVDGHSLEASKRFEVDWKRLAETVSKTRLRQAFERYRAWYLSGPKRGTTRRRDEPDSRDVPWQEPATSFLRNVRYSPYPYPSVLLCPEGDET